MYKIATEEFDEWYLEFTFEYFGVIIGHQEEIFSKQLEYMDTWHIYYIQRKYKLRISCVWMASEAIRVN